MGVKSLLSQLQILIRGLDIFGAPLQLAIQSKETQIQSILGGVSTIFIYSSSAAYFLYILYSWKMKQILPNVNTQHISKNDGDYFPLNFHFFRLNMYLTDVTPENEKELRKGFLYNQSAYYYPDYTHYLPTTPNKDGYGCGRDDSEFYYFTSICMNLKSKDQDHLYQDQRGINDTYLMYQVTYCNKTTQPGCISFDELFAKSKKAEDSWELTLVKQDVNIETGEIFTYGQNYYFWISQDTSKFFNLQLVITKAQVTIDDGFILPNIRTVNIISDITFMASMDESFVPNQGPLISVSLDKYNKVIQITYPKITEILASALGFFQTLIMTGFLINLLNSHSLTRYLQESLMRIYFPSLEKFKIERDWKGKVKYVTYKDKVIEDVQASQIEQFRERIQELILNKINIINILAEINKIQIAILILSNKNPNIHKVDYRPSFEQKYLKENEGDRQLNIQLDENDFLGRFNINNQLLTQGSQISPEPTPSSMDLSFSAKQFDEKSSSQIKQNYVHHLESRIHVIDDRGVDSTIKMIYED